MSGLASLTESTVQKLKRVSLELNSYFLERSAVVDASILTLVSGTNAFLLGPPGTAKTAIIRAVTSHVEGAEFFYCLLTKFSTPDDVFGPLDVAALSQGTYRRLTAGKLPSAHVALLDEIFKASPAILNSLLTVLNERVYNLDGTIHRLNVLAIFAASNELPEDDALSALYDRLLVRIPVDYLKDARNFEKLLKEENGYVPTTKVSLDELVALQEACREVTLDDLTAKTILKIKHALESEGVVNSDRRYKQCVRLVKARALLDGRDVTTPRDASILAYCLWSDPEHYETVKNVVFENCDPVGKTISESEKALEELSKKVEELPEARVTPEATEVAHKLQVIIDELSEVDDERAKELVERAEKLRYELIVNKLKIRM